MPWTIVGGDGGSGGSGAIPSKYQFSGADVEACETARDDYFTANQSELSANVRCILLPAGLDGVVQQYISDEWVDVTDTYIGPKGDKGDQGDKGEFDYNEEIQAILETPTSSAQIVFVSSAKTESNLAKVTALNSAGSIATALCKEAADAGEEVTCVVRGQYGAGEFAISGVQDETERPYIYIDGDGHLSYTVNQHKIGWMTSNGVVIDINIYNATVDVEKTVESLNVVAGIYDTVEQLETRYPNPPAGLTAIVRLSPDTYYKEQSGAWVDDGHVAASHPRYIGSFSNVDGLPDANDYDDGALGVLFNFVKEYISELYIVSEQEWTPVVSANDIIDITNDIDDDSVCTITLHTRSGDTLQTPIQLNPNLPPPSSDTFSVLHFWTTDVETSVNDIAYALTGGTGDEIPLTLGVTATDYDDRVYTMIRDENAFKYPFFAIPKSAGIRLTGISLDFLFSYDWIENELTNDGVVWRVYTGPTRNNAVLFSACKLEGVVV